MHGVKIHVHSCANSPATVVELKVGILLVLRIIILQDYFCITQHYSSVVFMIQDKGTCTNTDHVTPGAAAGSQVVHVLFSDLEETPGPSHQGAEAADHSEDSTTTLESATK